MKQVVIFGTGDFAQVAYVYLSKDSPRRVAAFTVHEKYIAERTLLGLDVVPFEQLETRYPPSSYAMFVAVGFSKLNRIRTELYGLCKRRGYELITYINRDRKSTRLNSSHRTISYAVFCLKKKNYRRSISSPSY